MELESFGLSNVAIYTDKPEAWGDAYEVPDGFLECDWYVEGVWSKPTGYGQKPASIYRYEKVD